MEILVPICVCVILPIAIVLIEALRKAYTEKTRAKLLSDIIESGKDVDTDSLISAFKKPVKSPAEILSGRLLRGCIFSLIGVALLIFGSVNLISGNATLNDDPVTVPFVFGGISLAIGISFLIVYFTTRKAVSGSDRH